MLLTKCKYVIITLISTVISTVNTALPEHFLGKAGCILNISEVLGKLPQHKLLKLTVSCSLTSDLHTSIFGAQINLEVHWLNIVKNTQLQTHSNVCVPTWHQEENGAK